MNNILLEAIKEEGFSDFLAQEDLNDHVYVHLKGRITKGQITEDSERGSLIVAVNQHTVLCGYDKNYASTIEPCRQNEFIEILGTITFETGIILSYVNHIRIITLAKSTDNSCCFSSVIMRDVNLLVGRENITAVPTETNTNNLLTTSFALPFPLKIEKCEKQLPSGQWIKCPESFSEFNHINNVNLYGHLHQKGKKVILIADGFQ